jgi:hypothetical protein
MIDGRNNSISPVLVVLNFQKIGKNIKEPVDDINNFSGQF